jgi:dTDP-glucose pyrophosphorylase
LARTITDFASYLVGPELRLRDVMARINQLIPPMLIVASEDRRFLGTITDGDIRRLLLRGGGNDSLAREIMQPHSTTGLVSTPQDNRRKLDALVATIRFLPVLNEDGTVAHLLLEDGPGLRSITALVMAGGFGRRLGDLTRTTPKPLLPVAGRPILDHVLESLESAGIRRIFISTHYLADQIESFVEKRDSIAKVRLVHETAPLGTGGAIGLLPSEYRTEGDLIVLNGDLISDVSFDGLVAFHRAHGHNATICVKEHRTPIEFGVIHFSDNNEFERIEEKPELSHFIAAGIYILDPAIAGLTKPGVRTDMPDLLNRARDVGLKVGVFPVHEHWIDVGRPRDLASAEKHGSEGKRP